MKFYFTITLLILSQFLYAQNRGILTGEVLDFEKTSLAKATISVLNQEDSSVVAYSLADDKGKFKLYKLPLHKTLTLVVSYVGTTPFSKELELTSEEELDLGPIVLDENILDEVQITSQPPVSMNNDTLEYNAKYFKTKPDASVEELMKKLPGLQVNMDGSIYYQGKEVSKVLVNNKEFFAQDLRIATRNLDASMVDVVQVYRDKGDSKKAIEDESTLPVTINLKFKKELARADFGKFYGSGGSRDRYESGLLLNTFRDTLQVSFIGFGNNINRQSFDYGELSQHAGLGRAENYGFQNFGGRNYSGVQNDISGGVNVNYDWGNITKLSIMYQYTYGDVLDENSGESETFYDQDTQNSRFGSGNTRKTHRNSLSGRFNHKFDTTAFIRYSPNFTFNKSKNDGNYSSATNSLTQAINETNNRSNGNSQDMSYRHNLTFEKAFTKEIIFSLNNDLSYNDNDNRRFNSQLSTIYVESLDPNMRLVQNNDQAVDFSSKVIGNLQFKLHKNFNINFFSEYSNYTLKRDEELALAIDDEVMKERGDSENDLHFRSVDYVFGSRLSWTILKNITFQAGIKNTHKRNTFDYLGVLETRKDNQMYWLPSLNFRYKNLTINYVKNVSYPQLYSIRTVDNTIELLGITKAFPYAENMLSDQIDLSMYQYFNNYRTQLSLYGSYNKRSYSFGYKNTQDLSTGRYENEAYIAPGIVNLNVGANYSQQFKLSEIWNLRLSQNFNSYTYENYQILNNVENKNTSRGGSSNSELTFSWRELIAISPKYGINFSRNLSSTTDPNYRNSSTFSHNFTAGFNLMNVKNFSLESSYRLTSLSGGFKKNPIIHIVNVSLYYDMNKKGQLKLSAFDLLNQNISIYNSSYHNSNYYNESITLKQYFLLGYIYKFNRIKVK